MHKKELVDLVHLKIRHAQTKRNVAVAVGATLEAIADAIARGETLVLPGIGTFSVKRYKKGAMIPDAVTSAKRIRRPENRMSRVKFTVSSGLLDEVNRRNSRQVVGDCP